MDKLAFIQSFQQELIQRFSGAQNWWPKSLFHFTHFTNAANIIEAGALYSRKRAEELGLMHNDNANQSVIALTRDELKNNVRLYFGPSTPTQYKNEGIRPKSEIEEGGHCPVPVMFVFDFAKVFTQASPRFTNGNLAKNPIIFQNIEDLNVLNFEHIYHRTYFSPEHRDQIINARHSEVLVEDELPLDPYLKVICVRSEAEKETFLHAIRSPELQEKYRHKIFIQPQTGIFINEWLYVKKVTFAEKMLQIEWHPCTKSVCEQAFKFQISANSSAGKLSKDIDEWHPSKPVQKFKLPDSYIAATTQIELTIKLDGHLAYQAKIANSTQQRTE